MNYVFNFQCTYTHLSITHSMCSTAIPGVPVEINTVARENIIKNHNRIRNSVDPPATGIQTLVMLNVYYLNIEGQTFCYCLKI